MAKTKSGRYWVTWANVHAKNSSSLDDLEVSFRSKAREFISALEAAGAKVNITATRRSAKRAYLFHWSWKISQGRSKASDASTMDGVDIEWDHGTLAVSKAGAQEMVGGFDLAVPPSSTNPPSLKSLHISGKAVDMDITWEGKISVKRKDGKKVEVTFMDDVNANKTLHAVGASYGVRKLATDRPHWSYNGR